MSLAFPKPTPRRAVVAQRRRDAALARRLCVLEVFRREMGRCQGCGKAVVPAWAPEATPFNCGHVHEVRPRSLGGDPSDPAACRLLCPRCHEQAHRRR